uniref:Bowman-Birk serine protease inhibitors family domain-containing protein n=1 Tax=Oryza punctata TaxID=4537 RepID=A0A0E0JDH7_ORYPU
MKMKSIMAAASVLLFFLLAGFALAPAHGSTADVTTETTIRLPSDGGAVAAIRRTRPWKCCDNIEMLPVKTNPPQWRCNDELNPSQCFAQCEACRTAPGPFPGGLLICDDVFWGDDPGPSCAPAEWPWGPCCDSGVCTASYPPICRCDDEVESCAAACRQCEMVDSWSWRPLFVCRDQFTGDPGPRCTPDTHN